MNGLEMEERLIALVAKLARIRKRWNE